MLVAGDLIDAKLGSVLAMSTLCAAACGNIVGDVAGVWLGGTVEALASKLGLPDHKLTSVQMRTHRVQTVKTVGSAFGVLIGCILGMFPLIWPARYRFWPTREEIEAKEKLLDA